MRKGFVSLAAAVLLMLPQQLSADVNWDYHCIGGSFDVCASVRVQTSYDVASGTTQVTMQVWNLEGTLGNAHTITSLGLYHVGGTWAGSVVGPTSATWYQNGGGTTDISSYWTAAGASDIQTLAGVELEVSAGTSGNDGINGCTVLPGGDKWSTCLSGASSAHAAPYVEFSFTVTGEFLEENLALRWHSQQIGPDANLSAKCDTGGNGDYPPCTRAPEPMTMALFGSGLVAFSGAQFFRRRKLGVEELDG